MLAMPGDAVSAPIGLASARRLPGRIGARCKKVRTLTLTASHARRTSMLAVLFVLVGAGVADAATVTRLDVDLDAEVIAAGPDGNLWLDDGNAIARVSPAGDVAEFNYNRAGVLELAAGPDGNIWFTDFLANRVGRITPSGKITLFSAGIPANSGPDKIVAGPNGNVWFTEPTRRRVARITPTGTVTQFSAGIPPHSGMSGIGAGPDGNVWFGVRVRRVMSVARITPRGQVTLFSAGLHANVPPTAFAAGPDGNVWFTQRDRIGRITPSGKITEFRAGISPRGAPDGIAAGADGNLWFTEFPGGRLGRITPAGKITEFSAGLSSAEPLAITAGPQASLWLLTTAGVARLTPTPGTPVSILTRHARVSSHGATRVELACGKGAETCSGTLELTIRVTKRVGRGQPFITTIVLARARFGLSPGQHSTVALTLNSIGRRYLAHARGRRLTTRYRAATGAGDEQGALILTATRRLRASP
jgi:streptogramin lyase